LSSSEDVFVTRIRADLQRINQTTYLGTTASDISAGIAIHPARVKIYLSGTVQGAEKPSPAVTGGAHGV
jgi:hypothetical protein